MGPGIEESEVLLRVTNSQYRYGPDSNPAISGIDFSVNKGELLIVAGPVGLINKSYN